MNTNSGALVTADRSFDLIPFVCQFEVGEEASILDSDVREAAASTTRLLK